MNIQLSSFLRIVTVVALALLLPNWGSAEDAKVHRILLLAGRPSHGPGDHEFNAGQLLLAKCLNGFEHQGHKAEVKVVRGGWPEDDSAFDNVDTVVCYADGGDGHPLIQGDRIKKVSALAKRGIGIMCMHYGVEVPATRGGPEFQDWIGGYYESLFSCNPMWKPDFTEFPKHAITSGVKPFSVTDEWYFNMRFRPEMKGVTSILVAKPSDAVREGPYVYPAGPYPHILKAKGQPETMMWCVEREDGGRGVGFTGGHRHANWADDNYRKVVLNAIAWSAKMPIPEDGIPSKVSDEDMKSNLDPKGK